MRIAVLCGADSPERDVSLRSGAAVAAALERGGHEVTVHDLDSVRDVLQLDLAGVDVVFPALHGGAGEDGHLQAILDVMEVPYALSGPGASALAMNKAAAKRLMVGAGIPTPAWLLVTWDRASGASLSLHGQGAAPVAGPGLTVDHVQERAAAELDYPLVIKLNAAGSSVGVEIVQDVDDFPTAFARVAEAAAGCRVEIIIEAFVPGREFTATILLGRRLPLLEIRPRSGFYDFGNKYTDGASEYLCPAPVDSPYYENMCADALAVYDLLGCRGVARIDFRFDGARHHCLEANTIPGMTELSLVPMAAAAVEIGFEALVQDLCCDARLRRGLPLPD